MIEMTLRAIADVVGGTLHDVPDPEVRATGAVEFDSRRVGPGDLFLALPGSQVDGHDFAAQAMAAGAVAVLATRPVGVPAIVMEPVADAAETRKLALAHDHEGAGAAGLAALAALARANVDKLGAHAGLTVVGVTGSSGKTSTKDLLASVLAPDGPVVAPPGSFNNELGHPWTVLQAGADTRFLVLELSARGPGHIRALTQIAPLDIGVVLNVGTAHLGEFGDREAIARAKSELVQTLSPDAVAVLNADDPAVAAMAAVTRAHVVTVGRSAGVDVRATDVALDEAARARFTLHAGGDSAQVRLAVHGEHQVGNALCAAAVALQCGADVPAVAKRLSAAQVASPHRMDVRTREDGVTIVNDAYNANPDSMAAAVRALVTMARPGGRRSWAVLGEMGELGPGSVDEHQRLGQLVVQAGVDRLVVVGAGPPAQALRDGAAGTAQATIVPDAAAAVELLQRQLAAGDVVLVKASNAAGLWAVAQQVGAQA